jgi:hypothetical protein
MNDDLFSFLKRLFVILNHLIERIFIPGQVIFCVHVFAFKLLTCYNLRYVSNHSQSMTVYMCNVIASSWADSAVSRRIHSNTEFFLLSISVSAICMTIRIHAVVASSDIGLDINPIPLLLFGHDLKIFIFFHLFFIFQDRQNLFSNILLFDQMILDLLRGGTYLV